MGKLGRLRRERLETVLPSEFVLAMIAEADIRAGVADVVEMDAVEVVLREALDHQVALELADLGLAEVVPQFRLPGAWTAQSGCLSSTSAACRGRRRR